MYAHSVFHFIYIHQRKTDRHADFISQCITRVTQAQIKLTLFRLNRCPTSYEAPNYAIVGTHE